MPPAPKFSQTVQSLQEKRGAARSQMLTEMKNLAAPSGERLALVAEPLISSTTATDTGMKLPTITEEIVSSGQQSTGVPTTPASVSSGTSDQVGVESWLPEQSYSLNDPRLAKLAEGLSCSVDQTVDKIVVWMTQGTGNPANWRGRPISELVTFYLDNFYLG